MIQLFSVVMELGVDGLHFRANRSAHTAQDNGIYNVYIRAFGVNTSGLNTFWTLAFVVMQSVSFGYHSWALNIPFSLCTAGEDGVIQTLVPPTRSVRVVHP